MKTARKVLTLALCAILLVSATIMGTMAYLTSTDEVKNTFTVGNVQIKLDEAKVENGVAVTPEVRVKENSYKLLPGHSYDKDPTVTVLKGSEESYVRMLVTINMKSELDAIGMNMAEVFVGEDTTKWIPVGNGTEGTDNTMVYEFRYYQTVTALDDEVKLPALFTDIVVPGTINNKQLETLNGLEIKVVAQAIQADGFATAEAAWAQWK